MPNDVLLALLWTLAALVFVWGCVPLLLHVLGLTRLTQHIEASPTDLGPSDDEADYDDVYHQLAALGFKPLGAYWDRLWFFYFHWVKSFRTRVFFRQDSHCYACVYRLAAGERIRMAFVTCFTDESLVWTGNSLELHQFPEEDWVRWGHVTDNLADLYELHEEMVGKFRTASRSVDARDELASLLGCVARVNERYIHQDRRVPARLLKVAVLTHGICPIIGAFLMGIGHTAVPIGVLFGGGAWQGFRLLWPRVVGAKRAVEIGHAAAYTQPR
jgi:hypothetical protein